MAADPESLDVELAASVFKEMGDMMVEETKLRQAIQEMVRGILVLIKDGSLALKLGFICGL